MASGKAYDTKVEDAKNNNFAITKSSRPFPTRSSMYFQRNWRRSINKEMKKVNTNGPKNDLIM